MDCSLELLQASAQLLPKCISFRQSPCYITSVVDWALTIKSLYNVSIRSGCPSHILRRCVQSCAGLHDNVPVFFLLLGWQKVRQFRATQTRCLHSPRLSDNFCRAKPPFGIATVLMSSAMVASWYPSGATMSEGRSGWDVVVQLTPAL